MPARHSGRVMYLDEAETADPRDRTPKIFNLINGHTNVFVLGQDAVARCMCWPTSPASPFIGNCCLGTEPVPDARGFTREPLLLILVIGTAAITCGDIQQVA